MMHIIETFCLCCGVCGARIVYVSFLFSLPLSRHPLPHSILSIFLSLSIQPFFLSVYSLVLSLSMCLAVVSGFFSSQLVLWHLEGLVVRRSLLVYLCLCDLCACETDVCLIISPHQYSPHLRNVLRQYIWRILDLLLRICTLYLDLTYEYDGTVPLSLSLSCFVCRATFLGSSFLRADYRVIAVAVWYFVWMFDCVCFFVVIKSSRAIRLGLFMYTYINACM